ncbi:hypothetical protein STAFG_8715 [Streptomyces afghaniensis 772]|uniref:Uncharacterized protein n=1 Tax=Streptomyces afghaniensis 772 TaxID=1283301 RepID=S4MFD2_9ACTN|nr:hypothetical protein [Streptomyces afghaniensis]EPJ34215.1 hypothetical protein STAFG_8715 [Streptomyces afghaniensis 772]
MSDVFAVDLALDLSPTVPEAVLAHLRRHVEGDSADDGSGEADWPALQGADHWSLTARQEIHAELLAELVALADMLAFNAKIEGVIGQVRFYEDDISELLVNRSGTLVKMPLRAAEPNASRHVP